MVQLKIHWLSYSMNYFAEAILCKLKILSETLQYKGVLIPPAPVLVIAKYQPILILMALQSSHCQYHYMSIECLHNIIVCV